MSSLSLKISGQKFDFFNSFELNLNFNSIGSTFSFEGLVFNDETKNLFRPFGYKKAEIFLGDNLLLTGTILNVSTSAENQESLASISGYAKTGVLEDCNIPYSLYPLQFDKLTIREIVNKLLRPFELNLIVDDLASPEIDKKYDKSSADIEQSIKGYIQELVKQRNVILSHTSSGDLLMTKINVKQQSIATYEEGMPATRIGLIIDGQGVHSEITVQKQASLDVDFPGEITIQNDLVSSYRPFTKEQIEGNNNDTEKSANAELAAELRSISLIINTDRWILDNGEIIKPNSIIEVLSPTNFINNKTRFFVENVTYTGNNEGIRATLDCVLPEVYNGQKPTNIFA